MSWLDDTRTLTAIVLSAALVGAVAANGLIYPEFPVPEYVITWANMAFQFLLGTASTFIGMRIQRMSEGRE